MQLDDVFTEVWSESVSNVEVLSAYRLERAKEFPGVPVRHFTDWLAHREWMRAERVKSIRKMNNQRIKDVAEQDALEKG
jgi:hypothetical protein